MVMVAIAMPFLAVIVQRVSKENGHYARVQWDGGGHRVDVGISVHADGCNETRWT